MQSASRRELLRQDSDKLPPAGTCHASPPEYEEVLSSIAIDVIHQVCPFFNGKRWLTIF